MSGWTPIHAEALYYVVRPDGTPIWLPADVMRAIGAKKRDRLTAEQWNHPTLCALLDQRRSFAKADKKAR